jgi:hypothetical protein
MIRGFLPGTRYVTFVSGVDGRIFSRRFGASPFETSGGKSICCFEVLPSWDVNVTSPLVISIKKSTGFGNEGPCCM